MAFKHLRTIASGVAIGAASWFFASVVSGEFEVYDSSMGLAVNQSILSVSAALVATRYRASAALLFIVSAYLGLNSFAYVMGSSESRVWAGLGAVVSVLLFLIPVIAAFGAVTVRTLLRARARSQSRLP